MKIFSHILKTLLIGLIRIYQITLSKLFPPICRHIPSCSNYAVEAINVYGPFKGIRLSVGRILKCHPFGTFGYDPLPAKDEQHAVKDL
ncbi:MAG: membrane protein insertion efficiency factor YidD [Candidatus Omnitrophica bacterium]|nr:membrane protein insertion efficiency factor YidD [Candidatus Omnitrophota bacterium]